MLYYIIVYDGFYKKYRVLLVFFSKLYHLDTINLFEREKQVSPFLKPNLFGLLERGLNSITYFLATETLQQTHSTQCPTRLNSITYFLATET